MEQKDKKNKRNVTVFWPAIPREENVIPAVKKLLWPPNGERPFVGEGEFVEQFEYECAKKFGFDYVLFTNSGTGGLDIALLSAGVKAGDEVITTPMTCTVTNTVIVMRQAVPVFADVQYDTANIDPKDIEHRITEKTKAIMVVHWSGYPCEMDEINKIAKKHSLEVIADGAHALGASYKGKPISQAADYTMFSLQSIKQMTTIDGGLLAISMKKSRKDLIQYSQILKNRNVLRKIFGKRLNDYFDQNIAVFEPPKDYFAKQIFSDIKENKELNPDFVSALTRNYHDFESFWLDWQKAESARRRRWFGISKEERVPSPEKGYSPYPTFESGGKYHGNNLGALIGLAALKDYDNWDQRRKEIVATYNDALKNVKGIKLFKHKSDRTSGNWLYNIHVERRDQFVPAMISRGVETSVVHERNDILPIFRKYAKRSEGTMPNLEKLSGDRICLPLHQNMSDEDVKYVIEAIEQGW